MPDDEKKQEDSPYSESFVAPESYDTYEMRQQIISHLLFYKAIIDEEGSGERITKYMDLVEALEEGLHIPIKDPFHKAIALTFELVMQERINPWNVDLLKFSSLYIERVKEDEDVDFITAGKLMLMAWEILRRQTEEVMARSKPPPPPQVDAWDNVDIAGDWYVEDESFDFTKTVVDANEIPLEEKIWRPANRKVTLFELVEAFDEARKEVEVFQILRDEREKERNRLEAERKGAVSGMVHKESIEQDITMTWKRLENLEGNIPLSNICKPGDRQDRITTLVSILFLAKENKVKIWQVNFPFGEIYVKHLTNGNGFTGGSVPPASGGPKEEIQLINRARGKRPAPAPKGKGRGKKAPEPPPLPPEDDSEPDENAADFPEDLVEPEDPEKADARTEKEAKQDRRASRAKGGRGKKAPKEVPEPPAPAPGPAPAPAPAPKKGGRKGRKAK